MSRPKEFDRAEALTAAKAVFWRKGYDATTTDDLRHAMSIGRQSLYDSFGGKRPLYLEVLQRYNTERVVAQITRLRAAKSPLAGIRNLLLALANEPEEEKKLGCMGVAAVCAFGDEDPEITAIRRVCLPWKQCRDHHAFLRSRACPWKSGSAGRRRKLGGRRTRGSVGGCASGVHCAFGGLL